MTGSETLPLFPLNTVLFPGVALPLHVFEDRYLALLTTLLSQPPAQRRFGVVAIRRGWEAGQASGSLTVYDVGTIAQLREARRRPDGSFDIVTVGRDRFSIAGMMPGSTPYLQASAVILPEPAGPTGEADALAPRVLAAFRAYLQVLRRESAQEQLPENPQVLSYLVAATATLTLAQRQELLVIPDTAARLRAELRLLRQEAALLDQIRAVPASLSDLHLRPGPN